MGDLFNTLNKSLPGRSSMPLEGQFLCCAVTFALHKNIPQKMFSCLRRSDRRESDGMGHVCIVFLGWLLKKSLVVGSNYINTEE